MAPLRELTDEEARALGLAPAAAEISDEQALAVGLKPPAPPAEIGKIQAAGLGFMQGSSMGFADKGLGWATAAGQEFAGAKGRALDPTQPARAESGTTWREMFTGKSPTAKPTEAAQLGGSVRDAVAAKMKQAKTDQPWTFGLSELGGAVLSPIKAPIGLVGRPVLGAAIRSGVEGGVSGIGHSEAKDAKGLLLDGAKGVGLGVVGGAVAGKVTQKLTGDKAIRAYERQVSRDITKGADPTHARRAVPDAWGAELVTDFVEKYKPIKQAIGDPDKLVEETKKILGTLGAATKPVYSRLDKAVGEVPLKRVAADLDAAIAARGGAGDQVIRKALSETKDAFLSAPDFAGRTSASHQEIREWVTLLLKQETTTVGSLSETLRSTVVADLHRIGHDVLDNVLDEAATKAPKLASDIQRLRLVNRDITAAARIKQVAENIDSRDFFKNMSLGDKIKHLTSGTGAIGGGLLGAGHGSVGVAAGAAAGYALPAAANALSRTAIEAAGKLARLARSGNATAQAVEEAIQAGLPAATARALVAAGAAATARKQTEDDKEKTP